MRSRSGGELPQLELDCLAVLWQIADNGGVGAPASVATVHARLAERGRPLAYTTVLTVMDRLRRKQVVERKKQGRAYLYTPLVSRQQMRERALDRLVANYFDDAAEFRSYVGQGPMEPAAEALVVLEPEPGLLD